MAPDSERDFECGEEPSLILALNSGVRRIVSPYQEKYRSEIIRQLVESRGYKNVLEAPKLSKITVSVGVGTDQPKEMFDEVQVALTVITGQRPVVTKARKSIAGFKLREDMPVGVFVTLRGKRMYDFFYRLVNIALPRVRDFRGLSNKAFDGFGNYSMGITDHTIFTEVNPDKFKHTIGMNVTIVTSAKTNEEGLELLTLFQMPFAS